MIKSLVDEYNLTHQVLPQEYNTQKFFEIFKINTVDISMKYS